MTTVEKIHAEIDSAQDRLLKQALEIIGNTKVDVVDSEQAIVNKANRLKKIGFVNTSTVKTAEEIISAKKAKEAVIVENKEQAELIQYYQREYPFQKFLTEREFDKICEKYGLVYASVDCYIKEVPEKNIKDIEDVKSLKMGDKGIDQTICSYKLTEWNLYKDKYISHSETKSWKNPVIVEGIINDRRILSEKLQSIHPEEKRIIYVDSAKFEVCDRGGLFIAAPKSHFNLKDKTKKGLGFFTIIKQEVKDPIVFRYCRGGIQIITKWGLEAEDEKLINPINN